VAQLHGAPLEVVTEAVWKNTIDCFGLEEVVKAEEESEGERGV
jgi:hypothetical protein